MATLPSPTQVAGDHFGLFESWYSKLDPKNSGSIQAVVAAQFLKKSGLNDNLLSRIWDLSDPGGKGYLDKAGLFVALKLVALVQNGREPNLADLNNFTPPPNMGEAPPHPPPPVAKSPGPPLVPAPPAPTSVNPGVWTITPADRTRYDQIFNSLGPEANKVHGNKVRGVMINSKLPTDTLGKIWDLADMDKDGSLDRVEFSIAMHLIYKVLENNPMPVVLPQEMLSSARRAGVAAQGPVPAPLAPPQALIAETNKLQSSGPPPAPWVVTAADKARYDVMFHNADLDKDGFVSGHEIKGVFLQSGLPQMVLAHIWNICDIKQTGKLTSEQFALAMWLIQQKIAGVDPPSTLTPEMIPPTMRPKPTTEPPVVAKPTYSNPELQAIADEIEELSKDKLTLESEIQQKEASIRLKNNEVKNLQTELDTLSATLRQLENQKGAAQKRLDDLGQQKHKLEQQLRELQDQILAESEEVEALRMQVEEQETSLKAQEEEVMSKQKELNDLRAKEMELEASVLTMKNKIEQLSITQQETLLYISQVKIKIEELQDQERHMTEVITMYDSAISAGDASSLSESAMVEVHPNFHDQHYMAIGPQSPTKDALSPIMSPVAEHPETNGTLSDNACDNVPKAKDTSFVGGHDPFAQAFGGSQPNADPFAVWDSTKSNPEPAAPAAVDPFGGDAFVAKPAAQPKKSKQPPPRPAPPKTRPVKPPPPQINSNNNPTSGSSDPFGSGGGGWSDPSKSSKNGEFADFANFAEFGTQYSSANSSSSLKSPWGDDSSGVKVGGGALSSQQQQLQQKSNHTNFGSALAKPLHSSQSARGKFDPFQDAFGSQGQLQSSSSNTWGTDTPAGSSGFGSQNGGDQQGGPDPFGGDYDPFKDSVGIKEADAFSWDDEAEALFSDGHSDSGLGSAAGGFKDPFSLSDFSPPNKLRNPLTQSVISSGENKRSKSAMGNPVSFLSKSVKRADPIRSKTSLGSPGNLDFDFDPLSSSKTLDLPSSKSNEDLLNENFGFGGSQFTNNKNSQAKENSQFWPTNATESSNDINFNSNMKTSFALFGRKDSWGNIGVSARLDDNSISRQEQSDMDLAMALSKSLVQTSSHSPHRNGRSPSTGL